MEVEGGVAAVAVDLRTEVVGLVRQPGVDVGEDAGLGFRNGHFLLRTPAPDIMKLIWGVRSGASFIVGGHEMPLQVDVIFIFL